MTTLTLTKKNLEGVAEAARLMGVKEKEIVERAVLLYLESIRAMVDLEKEFKGWDAISDEALARTDRSLKTIS